MSNQTTRTPSEATQMALIASDVSYIKAEVTDIKRTIRIDYVTHDQFAPIRNLVYGLVSLILTAVIGAIMALVIR